MQVMARNDQTNINGQQYVTGGKVYDLLNVYGNAEFITDLGNRQTVGWFDEVGQFHPSYIFGYLFEHVRGS